MKKKIIKNVFSCLLFCLLIAFLISQVNGILLNKVNNRYYILEDFIEEKDEKYDVQVFGSCHAYTSFNPKRLEETHSISSYVFANPGEIIPTTYLRMMERFKVDTPKVALVDIWGLNPYETYSTQDKIFTFYMPVNIELIPFSLEKLEVIRDYESLDFLTENFAIAKYKDRITSMELTQVDFDYSFDSIFPQSADYVQNEMTLRKNHNGFAAYNAKNYTKNLTDYDEKQAVVSDGDVLTYEEDIIKYVDKIIALCEKYDVELIFYRAPYISTENELRKSNWLYDYCEAKGIPYFDLEKEIDFDHSRDFMDYYHLNVVGAERATDFLAKEILSVIQ